MTAVADSCHSPSPPSNFPDAETATAQDIIAAQQTVKQYLSDMEAALKCMDEQHDAHAHDAAVDDMQKTAAKFNVLLRAFKAKQKA